MHNEKDVKIINGRFHQIYICPICENYVAPWMEIRAKGWGKAQAARKMVRDHIRSAHPNKSLHIDRQKDGGE